MQESAIERHEDLADQFLWMAGGALLVMLIVPFAPVPALARGAAVAAVFATVVVLGAGYRVGHAGGELVYVHGAASAFTGARAASEPPAAGAVRREDHDADDRAHR